MNNNIKIQTLKISIFGMKELLKLEKDEHKYRIRNIINSLEFELYNYTNKWEARENNGRI